MGSRSEPRPAAFKRAQRADLLHLPFPHIAQTTFSSTSPSVSFYPHLSFSSPSCYSAMQMHLLVCPVLPKKKTFLYQRPKTLSFVFFLPFPKGYGTSIWTFNHQAVANVFNRTFTLYHRPVQLHAQALMVFVFPIFKSPGSYLPPLLNGIVQKYLKVSVCIMINRQIMKAAGNRKKVSS